MVTDCRSEEEKVKIGSVREQKMYGTSMATQGRVQQKYEHQKQNTQRRNGDRERKRDRERENNR